VPVVPVWGATVVGVLPGGVVVAGWRHQFHPHAPPHHQMMMMMMITAITHQRHPVPAQLRSGGGVGGVVPGS
jgi:hypothetical protein